MSLAGRRILVTGASSGIGRACAEYAAQLGASVILSGRRADALDAVRASLERPDEHHAIVGDLADSAVAQALPQRILEAGGPIDGFVHSAGIGPAMPIGVVSEDMVLEPLKVNYLAFMLLMKAFSKKKFVKAGFSAVAISSIAAEAGWAGASVYAGSKGALGAAVRALAMELAPKGIRVNAICPGHVKTPLFDAVAGAGLGGDDGLPRLLARQPLGLGRPEQVAAVAAFLLSEASSLMTGVSVPVDGGYLAQ